jgi:RNA polymerase sigma-70 factor (sigma-E family)
METAAVSGRDEDHGPPDDDVVAVAASPEERWAAFGDFYRTEHRRMVHVALLLTGSSETAQDVVQDSFVRVYGHWGRMRDPSGYLYRAVVNGCRTHHRRAEREQRLRDRAGRAHPEAVASIGADEMRDALASLPYRQRAALVLRFYDDLSEAEAAAVLGCRPGTVGSLVHRGLAQLKKVIEL